MELWCGTAFRNDSAVARMSAANRKLSEVVIDTLGEFHAVDPASCGLEDLGRPEGFLDRQVAGWMQRWHGARHADNPVAERVGDWVASRIPASPPPTLLHNDWRLDNMAVDPNDPGRCVAVYDWDMCTTGRPAGRSRDRLVGLVRG